MGDSNVPITAGAGTTIDTFAITGGDHQQVVRKAGATAKTNNSWTIATTGVASQIAADASRLGIIMINNGSGRVYLRFDSTIPTVATADWYLEAGDRYEMPEAFVRLAVSVLGQFAGGLLYSTLFVSA